MLYLLPAIAAFLIGAYSVAVLVDTSRRQPGDIYQAKADDERMLKHTCILLAMALVFGLALEGLLP